MADVNAPTDMTPQEVLVAFFTEMCAWEREAFQAYRAARSINQNDNEVWLKRKLAIISRYCTPKERVYSGMLSYGEPPQYDPSTEDITEVVEETPRRVVFLTQQRAGFRNKRRFVVIKKGDHWLVDHWQWFAGGKWKRGII